ncbi:MAG TPA: AraC family transcriptional regulator [Runella sp.]|nr:AraC family transcriptional regulator [Runella sp.]
MIYLVGTFIALFLAAIALTKKGRTTADLLLGIWMVVVGLHVFSFYSYLTQLIYTYPAFLGSNFPLPFLHGPLLYLYTLALTRPEQFQSKKWLLHGVLPLIIIAIYAPFWRLSAEQKVEVFKQEGKGYEDVLEISSLLLTSSGIFYVLATHYLLQKHRKRILNQFSNQEKINLNWLRFLFYAMGIIWFFIIFLQNDPLIFSSSSVFVVLIGYFGIKQTGIFTAPLESPSTHPESALQLAEVEETNSDLQRKKYAKSGLNEERAQELRERLEELMLIERLFIEPELALTDLANRLDTHPNYLSQVINEVEGINFYDYVNRLRVEEFKRLLSLPENQRFTLLALAYDCGFNSKSAFNRCFKKTTGLSPSEYAKQLKAVYE